MNQPQRSLSNLGMSKSRILFIIYIETIYQNRIEHQVHFIKQMSKVD